ncbi:phosphatidate cytidylyltransferase [Klebsiella pneumoniae]
MQYILTGVIVLIISGLAIHGLTLVFERVYKALFYKLASVDHAASKVKTKVSR